MTNWTTPDLCDAFPDDVQVLQPMLRNFGGNHSFGGEIVTIKCHEDNSLVKEQASLPGRGRVMVVDGGGSLRKALLGDMIAEAAVKNGWAGLIIYGCVRDVDALAELPLGVQALASIPLKTEKRGIGDFNRSVSFGGVTFEPGAFVYADNNGVIVAPKVLSLTE
ncbi:ribonuclease E activity regulator RraA [Halioxenophilus sp. WMMB6]|uniref:ribonuclease E activity regulator RraA n=1 Tax=Halioxenophilus sp. WMMB6 TaxID=3073815 RepID=UPI00295EC87D|nr:ribonuclease E activity regulator RraA [Halioxenophilus sp. WMMB6]